MADCDVVDGCEGGVRCETTFCQAAEDSGWGEAGALLG